jgi:hypothetical protein
MGADQPHLLHSLSEDEWHKLLAFCDRMHLTLALRNRWPNELPEWVRHRIARNLADNSKRGERIRELYAEIASALREARIEHVVLKGFANSVSYGLNPSSRMQSDIDIYCPRESATRARDALFGLGYKSQKWSEHFADQQHLPELARDTDWTWRGNAFDPGMPAAVEIHVDLWNDPLYQFRPQGLDAFWSRRVTQRLDTLDFPSLDPVDCLAFSCLHILQHLIYQGLLSHHVYEIAQFLHARVGDEEFWARWEGLHDPSLRRLEVICFALARLWFSCDVHPSIREEIEQLPVAIHNWLERYALAAMYSMFRPNKDGLWLHLSLVDSRPTRQKVFWRRVVLRRVPGARAIVEGSGGLMLSRAYYHARLLFPTLLEGARWWRAKRTRSFGTRSPSQVTAQPR